jgi:hypothetical protein
MEVEPVVLDRDLSVGPREVESPKPAIAVDDLELQHWVGQTAIDHHESGLALHRRLCLCCGKRNQFAHIHDSAPPRLRRGSDD